MRTKIFIIIFITISVCEIFPQAVDISFSVTSGIDTLVNVLRVGLDTTATDSIDSELGEYEYFPPPPPPTGGVEALFYLSPYNIYTFRDYRNAPFFPFTGTREHTLCWDIGNGTAFTIFYSFPLGVSAIIKDTLGGIYFNENLSDSGSFTCPNNLITSAKLTMYYDNVVPVELISFNATSLDNNVRLDWTTATETNNSEFEIQRKESGDRSQELEWEAISFISGFGTTTEPKSYSFIDENVAIGIYKYRLKQIDFDGTFTFSNEIEVVVDFTPKEFVLCQNYPNPFNPKTVISYQLPVTGSVTLKVYDILGNEVATLVNENKQAGVYEIEFSVGQDSSPDIASGIYFYQLNAGSFVQTKKLVLLK